MGLMNKVIGSACIIAGLAIFAIQKEIILPISLLIVGAVFIIFNNSEEEYEKRTDEKANHDNK